MATIQAYYFTKKGETTFDCKATLNDSIECEAIVSFSGAELGKRYYVNWVFKQPSGQDRSMFSDYVYVTQTTMFRSPRIPNMTNGTYTMQNLIVTQG